MTSSGDLGQAAFTGWKLSFNKKKGHFGVQNVIRNVFNSLRKEY